jgi:hypothetical protein
MNSKFEYTFPFTLWDRLRATLVLMPMRRMGVFMNIALPIAGLIGIALVELGPFCEYQWLTPICIAFIVLPLCALLGVAIGYAFNPSAREPFRYVIDADGVHVFAKSVDYSHRWEVISRVRRKAGYLMLFFRPGCAHCLPLSALERTGDFQDLIALLSSKGLAIE